MTIPSRMKFGVFLAPFHRVGENPTLAFERDLELLQWLDTLGFDEAYIGEHHSAGWETISSPEVFIAVAAERTRHIRLGTGVVSLPYHHPFMVASRITLLDHLTRGRIILGVGPGALTSDAYMLGIDPPRQRAMMDESMGIILRLFREEQPVTYKSDWFELKEATLQIRPFQRPHMPIAVASVQSPAGVQLAGKFGASLLSLSIPRQQVRATDLKELWKIAEETAAEHGQRVQREDWCLVVTTHLAESRQEAIEDVRLGAARNQTEYWRDTLGYPIPAGPPEKIVDYMVENGHWIIGTPDDCVAGIRRLQEASGGFGGFLVQVQDWAPREKLLRSYELLARYVAPQFQGTVSSIERSRVWSGEKAEELQADRMTSLKKADTKYYGAPSRP